VIIFEPQAEAQQMKVIPISDAPSLRTRNDSSEQGRQLHLPVAPRANVKVRFTSTEKAKQAMMPEEALAFLDDIRKQGVKVDTVMIAGPGDPLTLTESAVETMRLVREKYRDMPISLETVGIGGEQYAQHLAENGVSSVTLLVNAVSEEVAEKIYAWIRPGTKTIPLPKAVKILLDEQVKAVSAFKRAGCKVDIRTTVYPGCNDGHVEEIAKSMAALGVETMTVVPFMPEGEDMPPEPDGKLLGRVSELAAKHIANVETPEQSQMALVIPTYPEGRMTSAVTLPKPSRERPNVAVVSSNGMDIDLHLGEAVRALIYGPREDGLPCLLGSRILPEAGGGSSRWETLADTLEDCFALLAASAGENPRKVLGRRGITVLITDDNVEGTVDVLYGGGKKGKKDRR